MKYWDSSALIPLCLHEPHTGIVRPLVEQDGVMAVWWGSATECFSAFARLRRDSLITDREEKQLRHLLDLMTESWIEIRPSQDVRDTAAKLLLLHPLRAADALQLAAALVLTEKSPKGHDFVCLDKRLRTAAEREGFTVLPDEA